MSESLLCNSSKLLKNSSEVFSFSSDSYPPYVLLLELKGDDGILVLSQLFVVPFLAIPRSVIAEQIVLSHFSKVLRVNYTS